jgi:hypothetical protein
MHGVQALAGEDPQQVVFAGQEELRAARVALTAGTAAKLVVDAAAFVPFGAEDVEAAGRQGLLLRRRRSRPRSRPCAAWVCSGVTSIPRGSLLILPLRTRISTLPPSWMSVPRPAMLVAMVTAPGTPASATMCGFLLVIAGVQHIVRNAHRSCRQLELWACSRADRARTSRCETVPTRTGWPRCIAVLDLLQRSARFFSASVR